MNKFLEEIYSNDDMNCTSLDVQTELNIKNVINDYISEVKLLQKNINNNFPNIEIIYGDVTYNFKLLDKVTNYLKFITDIYHNYYNSNAYNQDIYTRKITNIQLYLNDNYNYNIIKMDNNTFYINDNIFIIDYIFGVISPDNIYYHYKSMYLNYKKYRYFYNIASKYFNNIKVNTNGVEYLMLDITPDGYTDIDFCNFII